MKTTDKIKMDAASIVDKMKRNERLTKDDRAILRAYSTLCAKKAGNAGKRKETKTGK